MTKTNVRSGKPAHLRLNGAALVMCLYSLVPSATGAQDAPISPSVQPSPLVRLTGVLKATNDTSPSAFPRLRVLIGDTFWLFHVCRAEPLIPAYLAEEALREVSGLGLRLLTEDPELSVLQRSEMHNRPIVLEGWLRVRAGVFRVHSVQRAAESAGGVCSAAP
jgi:hypothetical protein